jgi:hypothetical protein
MKMISTSLTASEQVEAIAMANAICNEICDDYEYNGNHTIADTPDQFHDECSPCCGIKEIPLKLTTNKVVWYCFDYGH